MIDIIQTDPRRSFNVLAETARENNQRNQPPRDAFKNAKNFARVYASNREGHIALFDSFVNTNTLDDGFRRQIVLQDCLADFKTVIQPLTAFCTVHNDLPVEGKDEVVCHYGTAIEIHRAPRASQRTKVTLQDGSYWVFGYDALGQLTSGIKYFWDGTPYAGQQFGYAFDTIGNRTSTEAGGDQTGANLRQASYVNTSLNQITSRDVPGDVDLLGLSLATNVVKVNGTNAYQKWEYFREQIATNNSSAAQWVGIKVTAPGQATNFGGVFVAKTPETFTNDLDGNQTQDGRHFAAQGLQFHLHRQMVMVL